MYLNDSLLSNAIGSGFFEAEELHVLAEIDIRRELRSFGGEFVPGSVINLKGGDQHRLCGMVDVSRRLPEEMCLSPAFQPQLGLWTWVLAIATERSAFFEPVLKAGDKGLRLSIDSRFRLDRETSQGLKVYTTSQLPRPIKDDNPLTVH